MKISITQSHINAGDTSAYLCPVALGIMDALPFNAHPGVMLLKVALSIPGSSRRHKVDLPREVSQFIKAFDRGESVSPIEFDLPVENLLANQ